jgi:adenine-specific DNA methylase
MNYPKRLIEVDLPIKRISAHARHEKSLPSGHIFNLHIWWARRPLVACRAIICAALWPDPADPLCPQGFREKARGLMLEWTSHQRQQLLSPESRQRFEQARRDPKKFEEPSELRFALLDFIADFSDWENSTVKDFLQTSEALTEAAHRSMGGPQGSRPLVVDPFAGGGSIPLEASRVGADAFATDLNPLPVLLNKLNPEYIPKFGKRLADEVLKWGNWVRQEAEKELGGFYPCDPDGGKPIAYIWARTVNCEGPGCGAEVPLLRSVWLAKKAKRSVALQLIPNTRDRRIDVEIITKGSQHWSRLTGSEAPIADPKLEGTVKRGSATCVCCGYTTPAQSV